MTYAAICGIAARTCLGDWPSTWAGLLSGRIAWTATSALAGQNVVDLTVGAVPSLDRTLLDAGEGPVARLADEVLTAIGRHGDVPLYVGSNHSETELVRMLLADPTPGQGAAILDDRITPTRFGRPLRVYAACASGLHALVAAAHDLTEIDGPGRAHVLAVDALSIVETVGFARAGALATDAARPFAMDRDGLTIGEGAVVLSLDAAPADAAPRILGIGMSCDAFHPTDPAPSGEPLQRAIRMALTDASLEPAQIAAIVAHGTGTLKGDEAEASALLGIWDARPPPVTSVKGRVGHLMGAAGLFNLAVAHEICVSGLIPPTSTDSVAGWLGDWVVAEKPRMVRSGACVLCVASGFGGNNVAVVVGVA